MDFEKLFETVDSFLEKWAPWVVAFFVFYFLGHIILWAVR